MEQLTVTIKRLNGLPTGLELVVATSLSEVPTKAQVERIVEEVIRTAVDGLIMRGAVSLAKNNEDEKGRDEYLARLSK
jgi:hypothetical protein